MILSRTPLRISFVGGGTDIATFYRGYGGAVISTAVDKYISVCITRGRNSQIAINTPPHREAVSAIRITFSTPLIREADAESLPAR